MTQKLRREFVVNTAVKMTYNDIKCKERGEKAAVVHWRTSLQVSLVSYTDVTLFIFPLLQEEGAEINLGRGEVLF